MTEIITENMTSDLVLSELSESSVEEPSQKANKKRGARWLPNGKYDSSPLDPEYHKKYYHAKFGHQYTCEVCGSVLGSTQKINRHLSTKKCQKQASLMQQQAI
jgi:hypothetical protein